MDRCSSRTTLTERSIALAAWAATLPLNDASKGGNEVLNLCMRASRTSAGRYGLRLAMTLLCVASQPACTDTIEERLTSCLACVGEPAQPAHPPQPPLGPHPPPYLLIQLFLFREKLRSLDIMKDAVKGLSNDDLRPFADTLSKLPPPLPVADPSDPARIERGKTLV